MWRRVVPPGQVCVMAGVCTHHRADGCRQLSSDPPHSTGDIHQPLCQALLHCHHHHTHHTTHTHTITVEMHWLTYTTYVCSQAYTSSTHRVITMYMYSYTQCMYPTTHTVMKRMPNKGHRCTNLYSSNTHLPLKQDNHSIYLEVLQYLLVLRCPYVFTQRVGRLSM